MPYSYEYPRPAVTVDAVVFRDAGNGSHQEVLLIQRKHDPFAYRWALPGGFMDIDETLESAIARELSEETGLQAKSVTQFHAFSAPDRDPRGRTISVAFLVSVEPDQQPSADDDAQSVKWFPVDRLPELAFDHAEIIRMAYQVNLA